MHGYEPGSVVPTTRLVLSHKHPDDREAVQDLLDRALHSGGSFFSRHRICDTAGDEHSVIVVADRMLDETGAVVGTSGYYVDVTEALQESRQDVFDETLPKVVEARAEIEQAKGALRVVYGINDDAVTVDSDVLLQGSGLSAGDAVAAVACGLVFLAGVWFFDRLSPHFEDFL